jgi:penicillin-binding protein 1A
MNERRLGDLRADPSDRVRAGGKGASRPPRRTTPTLGSGGRNGGNGSGDGLHGDGPPRRPPARRAKQPAPAPRKKRAGGGRWWRLGILACLWGVLALAAALAYFFLTLPSTDGLAVADRRPSVTLLAEDGSLVATFGDLFGDPVHLRELPPYVAQAVLATEDRRFYHHFGVDPIGLLRAVWADLRAGHLVQGGSTITQQVAKNIFLNSARTASRKIQEVMLALWLEHKFTKGQILEIYLNRVYLGAGTYGIDAAAHRYFSKPARQLTLYESAVIAGLLKAPTRFSPARDQAKAAERADQVLLNMVDAGYLTEAQATSAQTQKSQLAVAGHVRPGSRYFADYVAEQLASYGAQDKDVVVTTTLDPKMQAEGEQAITDTLNKYDEKDDVEQGALLAMSTDGAIRTMVGGRDYGDSQFNRATQAQRQPGSSFKPIVYLAALEHGIQPSDHFIDHPIRIGDWEPHNYENTYRGDVTVAEAVAHSINTVAAQVLQRVGVNNVIATAHRLGITSELNRDASLALGTSSVSLIELTAAYAAFANGGQGVWPYGIIEIRDTKGNVIYHRNGGGPGPVTEPYYAGEMNEMLMGVLDHGTGKAAKLERPAAGKTGTTQDFRDALFIGYTADLVTGVWLGNDDYTPMKHVTGGSLPAQTWHAFMVQATAGMPVRSLPMPGPEIASAASSLPPPSTVDESGAAGSSSGLSRLIHSIFGSDDHPAPAPPPPATMQPIPIQGRPTPTDIPRSMPPYPFPTASSPNMPVRPASPSDRDSYQYYPRSR